MYRRDLRDTDCDALLADLAMADEALQAVPSPNGNRLAYAERREDRIDLWLHEGGQTRRLTGEGVIANRYGRHDPRWFDWRPDGAALAYTDADGDLQTVDVEAGTRERLSGHDDPDTQPRWHPDGDELVFVTGLWSPGSLGAVSADGARLECLRDDDYLYSQPRWSADGDAVYAIRSRHRDLFDYEASLVRVSRSGDAVKVFAEAATRAASPRPRPGLDEVAFVHDGSGYDALYVVDADGDLEELFAVEGADVGAAEWHPDGDRLVATVTREGEVTTWVVTRDGHAERVSSSRGQRYAPAWLGDAPVSVLSEPARPGHVHDDGADEALVDASPTGFADRLVEPESLTYESGDGLEIHALVYLRDDLADAEPGSVPLLVKPHGGPTSYDGYGFDFRAQYLAALGYAVVLPNYRGSDGFGREFRNRNDRAWGEGDLDDVVRAADALADAYTQVDGDRAGIYGGSGGGLMTANALGRTDRFDAGAAFYGVYDYETMLDETDDVGWQLLKRELGFLATDPENYRDASPIRYVDDIDAPLLVLHGEDDERVPISQSEQLVDALAAAGKTHEFQRYEGEIHGLRRRESVVDAYTRVADLFAKYLRVDPDDGTSRPRTDG